jgi:hypothetical protein
LGPFEVSVEEEIADTSARRPHVVLLGAGASKAALPLTGTRPGSPFRFYGTSRRLSTFSPDSLKSSKN